MTELFNAEDIRFRTQLLAKKISDDHRNDGSPVIVIGLLNGAFMFYSELVKNISIDVECDFMRVKSYVNRKQGDIQITKDLETRIKGKHVYIVDDIYDTGNTMKAVIEYLEVKKPSSISIVSLIVRDTSPIPEQKSYHAFTIGDEWIVGMGMDSEKGLHRNLKSIWAL